jgi:hypothetical protein
MSTAVAMQIVLLAADPEPPRFSLLSVADRITQDRWEGGAGILGYAVGPPVGWEPCLEGTFRTKDDPTAVPAPLFNSFQSYLGLYCTGAGIGTWGEFQRRTDAVAAAAAAYPLERQLVHGDPMDGNPYLADGNLTVLGGGTAVAPRIGLSYLEEAIGNTGLRGVLHAPPAVATAWSGLVRSVDDDVLPTSELITTANGTPVAVGGGYTGADPEEGTAASGTQEWAFATGPVQVGYSAVLQNPPDLSEAMDRELNDVVYRAELDMLVAWDTQLQVGVLIDWAL